MRLGKRAYGIVTLQERNEVARCEGITGASRVVHVSDLLGANRRGIGMRTEDRGLARATLHDDAGR